MPQIFRYNEWIIYFWSNEKQSSTLMEPVHFHIAKRPTKNATKYWITSFGTIVPAGPNISKVPKSILNDITDLIESDPGLVVNAWFNKFGQVRFIDQQ
jgi:hypothetical protein